MSEIKLVKTEETNGCAIGCMATVMGRSYSEVSEDFENDFDKDGIDLDQIMEYLAEHGYSIVQKKVEYYNNISFGREELLKPFAPIHILSVQEKFDSENGHVVIMDEHGKIHCPSGFTEEEIVNSYRITDIIGIWKD